MSIDYCEIYILRKRWPNWCQQSR